MKKSRKEWTQDESITERIEKKQVAQYGHVQRMIEERLPKRVMKWIPEKTEGEKDQGGRGLRE